MKVFVFFSGLFLLALKRPSFVIGGKDKGDAPRDAVFIELEQNNPDLKELLPKIESTYAEVETARKKNSSVFTRSNKVLNKLSLKTIEKWDKDDVFDWAFAVRDSNESKAKLAKQNGLVEMVAVIMKGYELATQAPPRKEQIAALLGMCFRNSIIAD